MALYIAQARGRIKKNSDNTNSLNFEYSDTKSASGIFAGLTNTTTPTVGGGSYKIYQFGLQTLPGVQFVINDNMVEEQSTIRVGQTGIFELNLAESTPIQTVEFQNLTDILSAARDDLNVGYIFIDVIYSESETEVSAS